MAFRCGARHDGARVHGTKLHHIRPRPAVYAYSWRLADSWYDAFVHRQRNADSQVASANRGLHMATENPLPEPAPVGAAVSHAASDPIIPAYGREIPGAAVPLWADPRWRRPGHQVLLLLGLWVAYALIVRALGTATAWRSSAPPLWAWWSSEIRHDPSCFFWHFPPFLLMAGWIFSVRRLYRTGARPAWVLPAGLAFVLLFNISISMMRGGFSELHRPFTAADRTGIEYAHDVWRVHDTVSWLRDYHLILNQLTLHSRTHPPGAVLVLYWSRQIFGGAIINSVWCAILLSALAVVPVYLLALKMYGRRTALAVVALYALTPNLVLFGATSMDGVFVLAPMVATYLMYRALRARKRGALQVYCAAAGVVMAAAFMLTYTTLIVGLLLMAVGLLVMRSNSIDLPRRRVATAYAIALAAFALSLLSLHWGTGYQFVASLKVSIHSDHTVMETHRLTFGRYFDISIANVLAFLFGTGLVNVVLFGREIAADIPRLRRGGVSWAIALAATLLVISFARLFTWETERVWLMLAPLVVLCAAHCAGSRPGRGSRIEWAMLVLFTQTWLTQAALWTMW